MVLTLEESPGVWRLGSMGHSEPFLGSQNMFVVSDLRGVPGPQEGILSQEAEERPLIDL